MWIPEPLPIEQWPSRFRMRVEGYKLYGAICQCGGRYDVPSGNHCCNERERVFFAVGLGSRWWDTVPRGMQAHPFQFRFTKLLKQGMPTYWSWFPGWEPKCSYRFESCDVPPNLLGFEDGGVEMVWLDHFETVSAWRCQNHLPGWA